MEDARRFEEKILDRYARMLEAQGIHGPSKITLVTATTPEPEDEEDFGKLQL